MAKPSSARENLLDAAAELFRARGYEGVGVAELLERSRAPRGSLYFHFPGGKEQIGVEVVELVAAHTLAQYRLLESRQPDLDAYVDAIFKYAAKMVKDRNFDAGCPICAIALESGPQNPLLAAAVARAFASWEAEIAKSAQRWGMNAKNAADFANALVAAVDGAMIVAKSQRSTAAHVNAGRAIKALGRALLAQ